MNQNKMFSGNPQSVVQHFLEITDKYMSNFLIKFDNTGYVGI